MELYLVYRKQVNQLPKLLLIFTLRNKVAKNQVAILVILHEVYTFHYKGNELGTFLTLLVT